MRDQSNVIKRPPGFVEILARLIRFPHLRAASLRTQSLVRPDSDQHPVHRRQQDEPSTLSENDHRQGRACAPVVAPS